MSHSHDKRRHPRVSRRLRVRSDHHEALDLETIDLSAGGLSCTTPVFLPLMTKMALALRLPGGTEGADPDEQVVKGEAVVVRTEPPAPSRSTDGYRVALFFSRMEEADRQKLLNYLKKHNGKSGGA
ncbi:MAG TPA: PilZ domain-containing protein [Candidatus Polarisedimenticolia bacterium]|nr:PilZ domain-containing protein [Candidatus Polarisedimenticolia bacterium]